jgi:hypothetical protein
MNRADTLQAQGLASLLSVHGQTVTFRGVSARVLIDRTPQSKFPNAEINIAQPESSTVIIKITTEPEQGEVFFEGTIQHSIFSVRNLGYGWECRCNVNRP